MNLGARDRDRTGDPQLGNTISEIRKPSPNTRGCDVLADAPVTSPTPLNGLEGCNRRRWAARDSNPGPVSEASGIVNIFRLKTSRQQTANKILPSRWDSRCHAMPAEDWPNHLRPSLFPVQSVYLQVEAGVCRVKGTRESNPRSRLVTPRDSKDSFSPNVMAA